MNNFNTLCLFLTFVGDRWEGVSGVTWGSSEGKQRSFFIRLRMISEHFFDIFVGRSRMHPGVIWDHF